LNANLIRRVVLVATVAALAACGQREEPKTVAYYVDHKPERDARLAICKNNPGELKSDPDCVNAAAAVMKAWSSPDMPPITFAPAASAASR
jgi:type IV pilus biogenesis protein CpaD/CtpE